MILTRFLFRSAILNPSYETVDFLGGITNWVPDNILNGVTRDTSLTPVDGTYIGRFADNGGDTLYTLYQNSVPVCPSTSYTVTVYVAVKNVPTTRAQICIDTGYTLCGTAVTTLSTTAFTAISYTFTTGSSQTTLSRLSVRCTGGPVGLTGTPPVPVYYLDNWTLIVNP